jgi:hypothetical protein
MGAEDCPPGRHWDDDASRCICGEDSIDVGGVCKDQSTMCGPGTQWVDADKACVALTKYMSSAQIAAAVKAGVDLTGKGAGAQQVPIRTATVTPPSLAPKKSLMSIFGPNTPYIIGGIAAGGLVLALLAKKK